MSVTLRLSAEVIDLTEVGKPLFDNIITVGFRATHYFTSRLLPLLLYFSTQQFVVQPLEIAPISTIFIMFLPFPDVFSGKFI